MSDRGRFAILEAYGVTEEEADEIEQVVEEVIKTYSLKSEVIKELKRRFKGNHLLYAIGLLEFNVGCAHGMRLAKRTMLLGNLITNGYQ